MDAPTYATNAKQNGTPPNSTVDTKESGMRLTPAKSKNIIEDTGIRNAAKGRG